MIIYYYFIFKSAHTPINDDL